MKKTYDLAESRYLTPKHPQKFLGYLKTRLFKKYPHPVIIQGNTIYGLSQLETYKNNIFDSWRAF